MTRLSLASWVLLAGCGGTPESGSPERSAAEQEEVEAEVADEVVAAAQDEGAPPSHETLLRQLEASTARMADLRGDCPMLGESMPLLGDAVRETLLTTDTQNSTCEVRADAGFACETRLMNTNGGEDAEFSVFLRYQVDASGQIDSTTVECVAAG